MSKVISDQVEKSQLLISGLRKNLNLAKAYSVDSVLLNQLDAENKELDAENKELERLQQEIRMKSREAQKKLALSREKITNIKRLIKKNTDPSRWKDLGIMDKR
jgi:septation ring formation regulator EzrA